MKKLFYLAIVLCAIACTNKKSSVNYAKFEPEDGKCLVFIGQDMEAIGGIEGKEGYVNFFGTGTSQKPGFAERLPMRDAPDSTALSG